MSRGLPDRNAKALSALVWEAALVASFLAAALIALFSAAALIELSWAAALIALFRRRHLLRWRSPHEEGIQFDLYYHNIFRHNQHGFCLSRTGDFSSEGFEAACQNEKDDPSGYPHRVSEGRPRDCPPPLFRGCSRDC